jgi:hypothetical protein
LTRRDSCFPVSQPQGRENWGTDADILIAKDLLFPSTLGGKLASGKLKSGSRQALWAVAGGVAQTAGCSDLPEFLEDVLKGLATELSSDADGSLFIVADEPDARRLGEPRGTVYTAAEMRRVVQIGDSSPVLEIHESKRTFNACARECQAAEKGEGSTI